MHDLWLVSESPFASNPKNYEEHFWDKCGIWCMDCLLDNNKPFLIFGVCDSDTLIIYDNVIFLLRWYILEIFGDEVFMLSVIF